MLHVEPFVRVAELGSFRGAAARLGVSPAAVSKAVARLEASLGVRLLERTSRRVALTEEGRAFLPHARASLDALQAGVDRVAQVAGSVAGEVRLSVPHILASGIIGGLCALRSRHPHLTFVVRVSDVRHDLVAADLDVAVRIGEVDADAQVVARPLRTPRWAVVASPRYLGRRGTPTSPAELLDHDCGVFLTPRGVPEPWHFAGLPPLSVPAILQTDQGEQLLTAARAGLCVVQGFDFMVKPALALGDLVQILPSYTTNGPPVRALHKPGAHRTPRVRALLDFLQGLLHDTDPR